MKRIQGAVRWAIPFVWAAGMFAASRFDPWAAIGIATSIMTAAVLVSDGAAIRRLLQPSWRSAGLAAIAATTMIGVTYLLFPQLVRSIPVLGDMSAEIYSRFLRRDTPAVLSFVVPLVLAEEILWRGAFQEAIRTKSPGVAVMISATIYAVAHAPLGSALLVGIAFICGIYWAALRAVSGSLLPSLIAHLAWDVALIVVPLVGHSALR